MPWRLVSAGSFLPPNRFSKNIRIGLGLLWLIDAVLQLQPGMFDKAFYGTLPDTVMPSVLQDLHDGAPSWISWTIAWTQWLFRHGPVEMNLVIVIIQLALAVGLLLNVSERYYMLAAWGSVVWGVSIWIFGEALGGVGSWGDMTYYSGFPGSALLYAFAGLTLVMGKHIPSARVYRFVQCSVVLFLVTSGLLQVLPVNGQWDMASQMSVFANSGFQTQPGFLSSPVMAYSMWVSQNPQTDNILLSMMLMLAAFCVGFWRVSTVARWFVYTWLLFGWWFGMDFGYLFSGLSTDPNTPPILFALLFAMRPASLKHEKTVSVHRTSATENNAHARLLPEETP